MNRSDHGCSATLQAVSEVSMDELEQIQGGQTSMSWYRGTTVGEVVENFVNEATARYRALKKQYG